MGCAQVLNPEPGPDRGGLKEEGHSCFSGVGVCRMPLRNPKTPVFPKIGVAGGVLVVLVIVPDAWTACFHVARTYTDSPEG